MIRTRSFLTLILASTLFLGGCFNRDSRPIYVGSEEIDPIEAPAGLDQPRTRNIYEVPGYSLPELAAQGEPDRPPEVLPSEEAERSRSHIRFGPTGLYLAVEDQPESVWRRLGFSLNRGDMQVRQVREQERRYTFRFSHEPIRPEKTGLSRLAFWDRPDVIDYSGTYVARIADGSNEGVTRVELFEEDGSVVDLERAEFVLARLRDRLG
ncbi:MAG: hypothetical protein GVY32_11195 [Gammaproteobacteria bacterium]|nr:hypothetical protein [Gammaproteobacteria bacterium]